MLNKERTYNNFMKMLTELQSGSAYEQAINSAPRIIAFFEDIYNNGKADGREEGIKETELRFSNKN